MAEKEMALEEKDWLAYAAGDPELAEELRTGRCRCGVLLVDDNGECRRHEGVRAEVASALRTWTRLTGMGVEVGPRGEDLDLLGRFLPRDFLFAYEVLVHRGVVLGDGRGYDEEGRVSVRASGGLGSPKSDTPELNLVGRPAKKYGSGRTVVRSDAAVLYRRKVDRRLRRLAKEVVAWLEEGRATKTIRKCTGRKCGQFAEEGWNFCPNCGAAVDEFDRKDTRRKQKS